MKMKAPLPSARMMASSPFLGFKATICDVTLCFDATNSYFYSHHQPTGTGCRRPGRRAVHLDTSR